MSKLFYDHLIVLEEVEIVIKEATETPEEREELWNLIDEIIHHRVLGCILDHLPYEHHHEFLEKMHSSPHDERHIHYLNEKTEKDVEELLQDEIKNLEKEIIREIQYL